MIDVVAGSPILPIRIALAPELYGREDVRAAAVPAVKEAVIDLLATLGIPAQPEIALERKAAAHSRPVQIYVNEHPCRYSDELLLLTHSYVQGECPRSFEALRGVEQWFGNTPSEKVVEWLALLASHTLSGHTRMLLGGEHARAYCLTLTGVTNEDRESIARVLPEILELGISIRDKEAVAETFKARGHNAVVFREQLIAKLSPERVEVRVEREYLRSLTIGEDERLPELLPFLRDGLFLETGVPYGRFQIVIDDQLKPRSFAFRLNHLSSMPMVGPPDELILVNDKPEKIGSASSAEPALIPGTYLPGSLTARTERAALEAKGLTTWDGFEYLRLSFAGELRSRGWVLVNQPIGEKMLSEMQGFFPDLEDAVKEHLLPQELTSILRGLAAQQISIRNLRRIAELLLECEYFVRAGASSSERLAYISGGLADEFVHGHTKGGPLVAYLLDADIENAVARPEDQIDESVTQNVVDAIRAELAHLPPAVRPPAILANEGIHVPLRSLVAAEFPRIRVFSYVHLPPDVNVQPVARISLGTGGST